MSATPREAWLEANQRALAEEVVRVREALRRHASRGGPADPPLTRAGLPREPVEAGVDAPGSACALDTVSAAFGLTGFERQLLVLCAATELDGSFPGLCAEAHGDPRYPFPTFGLALAALPSAHWSALSPDAPLRLWRLVHVGDGATLTSSPLRIDERVLHYLTGVPQLDAQLRGIVEMVAPPETLTASHGALALTISDALAGSAGAGSTQVVQIRSRDPLGSRSVVAGACHRLARPLFAVRVANLPGSPGDRELLARLWEREAVLAGAVLLVECDRSERASLEAATEFVDGMLAPVASSGPEPLQLMRRGSVRFDLVHPGAGEQCEFWRSSLGPVAERMNGRLDAIVAQFNLPPEQIRAASAQVLAQAQGTSGPLESALWAACRVQARPHFETLAERITPTARWEDLVLPPPLKSLLRTIRIHVQERARVYRDWGFARRYSCGLGISALFSGSSGTGKTMAAEVLARELDLDLYRIDLSAVVSKYIGETEKNLRRVFDAAEAGGAVLLFDEADALFGRRSEVKDSHDRHANIEISYLLQRMESYRGLAILTTNMKNALDPAFLRRIRFIVDFPFPDAQMREEIWGNVFPRETPVDALDFGQLARLNVAGGNIRNIAMNAAFLAASGDEPVGMGHLLASARAEYAKIEKPLTDTELRGWAT